MGRPWGAVDAYQNASLVEGVLELIAPEDLSFLEDFESVHLLGVLLLDEEHLSVAALADDLDRAEVLHADRARGHLLPFAHRFELVDRLLVCGLL